MEVTKSEVIRSLQSLGGREELLARVVEFFPFPIQIFSSDGTARMINQATLDMIGIRSIEAHVGRYNVFQDPIVQQLGQAERIREVLSGKTVFISDFTAKYQDLIRYFNVRDRDVLAISSDITCFPVSEADGSVDCFAAVFIIRKIYRGKEEIALAKQYMETHWQEPFCADATARAAHLSKAYLTKLFKKHIGVTPHAYHMNYRIDQLKEKLLDANLSVSQAFAACNMDYSGYSARLFRERVGVPPSVYREIPKQTQMETSDGARDPEGPDVRL